MDEMLNGRVPLEWELAAVEHARQCERDRDLESLAGVLTEDVAPERVPRPVADVMWEFGS